MPSASEFSLTPSANVTIGGTNVAEGCSPGGLNEAIRYVASVCRDTFDRVGGTGTYLLSSGGTLTGDIFRATRGAYLHHAGSAQTDGRVMFLPEGSARPAGAEGMIVFYYA
jgi:hypothetical protein